MGKEIVFFVLLFFLAFNLTEAMVNLEIKQEYSQGETLIGKLSGVFTEQISSQDIYIYKGRLKIPTNFYLFKINDDYYFYTQLLGKSSGNYEIKIKDVRYNNGLEIIKEDISKNFSITNKTSYFSVNPGILTTDGDFSLKLQNLKPTSTKISIKSEDSENTITSSGGILAFLFGTSNNTLISGGYEITLKTGETKEINFKTENFEDSELRFIELISGDTSYQMPVYIFVNKTIKVKNFKFDPSELTITSSTNSPTKKIIYLFNTGDSELSNITISLSDSLKLYTNISIKNIESLKKNSSSKIELLFYSDVETEKIEGQITATEKDGKSKYCAVFLNFAEGYIPPVNTSQNSSQNSSYFKKCSELKGKICKDAEKCTGTSEYTRDGRCCLGNCSTSNNSGFKIIGWTIIIFAILFVIWFFKFKYKRASNERSLLDIAKGKK